MEQLILGQAYFLRPNLTVDEIAHALGTNRRYVQQTLNEEIGMPFAEYVNRLRIAHAERLLAEHPEMTKEEAAMQSGYTTSSTFYRNYAKYKGSGEIIASPPPCTT